MLLCCCSAAALLLLCCCSSAALLLLFCCSATALSPHTLARASLFMLLCTSTAVRPACCGCQSACEDCGWGVCCREQSLLPCITRVRRSLHSLYDRITYVRRTCMIVRDSGTACCIAHYGRALTAGDCASQETSSRDPVFTRSVALLCETAQSDRTAGTLQAVGGRQDSD
jgi:hypothetical protein